MKDNSGLNSDITDSLVNGTHTHIKGLHIDFNKY